MDQTMVKGSSGQESTWVTSVSHSGYHRTIGRTNVSCWCQELCSRDVKILSFFRSLLLIVFIIEIVKTFDKGID
jgi:hypothetical protein